MVLAELLGDSPGIVAVRSQVARLLNRRADTGRLPPVLLRGETGTGKGLLARALHGAGPRRRGPFVDVNCAAIPETLIEAEMFGVERGAFTGADRARPGLFQAAHGGTLFLDEIGLVPEVLQSKLLKAIEERTVRRLGRTASEPVDVWFLAATSEDLEEAMRAGRFRRELYHRLAVVTLRLPPLRERGEDVDLLAEHFLACACADHDLPRLTLAADTRTTLRAYGWPGNVRELANVIERAALLSDQAVITVETLALGGGLDAGPREPVRRHDDGALRETLESTERVRLLEALQQTNWNLSHAAAWLHLPRNTLRYRMERLGLRPPPPSRRHGTPPEALTARPGLETARPTTAAPSGGDRRRLTWLRADLVEGPSAALELDTSRALEVIADKIHGFGGAIEALSRTRVIAAFGLEPVEDAPRRAALTAVAVQKAAEHARRDGAWLWSVKLGIHVHDCVLVPTGSGVAFGAESKQTAEAVLEALVGAAPSDAVLISEAAARFLERRFDLVPEPPAESTGPAVYRLTGPEGTDVRLGARVTAFVGRREELALLESRLRLAIGGRGQVVAIIGEPGIGKSRLLFEFRQRLRRDAVTYLEGRCMSYGGEIPYLPVLEILRQGCGITETDESNTVTDKLRASLGKLGVSAEAHESYLLQLLRVKGTAERLREVNPGLMKVQTFNALRHVALTASRRRPLVLAVEDLHWIDKTSDDLLASLVASGHGVPILLVVTYRPGYQPPWVARAHVTQVALPPLSTDESVTVLRSALRTDDIAPQVAERVLARAEGNPFFLEELARAIGDDTELAADAVPDTVHSILAVRIDRLAPTDRRLLQTAAVIGKDVSVNLLQAIVLDDSATLQARLRQLQTADFVWETRPSPNAEYTFKHALTQEVAYGTLTRDERRDLHAKVARALVWAWREMAGPDPEADPAVIGRHCFHGELWDEAAKYLHQAGVVAFARSANREAAACLEQALLALAHLPQTRETQERGIDIRLELRNALHMLAEQRRIFDRLCEAKKLAEALDDRRRLGRALTHIAGYLFYMGDNEGMLAAGRRAAELAAELDDFELRVMANYRVGQALEQLGQYQRAIEYLRANVAKLTGELLYERFGLHGFLSVYSRNRLANCLAELGELSEGRRLTEEGMRIAEGAGSTFSVDSVVAASFWLGHLCLRQGEPSRAIAVLECSLALVRKWELRSWRPTVAASLGMAYALAGRQADAIPLLEEAAQEAASRKDAFMWWTLASLSEGYRLAGRLDEAFRLGMSALEWAQQHAERGHEAWSRRLLGDIAADREPPMADAGEANYRKGLGLAEELGMRPLAARCRLGLGTLYGRTRRREPAIAELTMATGLFKDLGMAVWADQTVAELRALTQECHDPLDAGTIMGS